MLSAMIYRPPHVAACRCSVPCCWRQRSVSRSGSSAVIFGGFLDAVIMRIADVQLGFPAILIALLIDGITRTVMDRATHDKLAVPGAGVRNRRILLGSVCPHRARPRPGRARQGVRAGGQGNWGQRRCASSRTHIRPNVMGPVLVIATINLALAILTEATLSFLGVGVPPDPALARLPGAHRQRVSVLRRLVDLDLSRRDAGRAVAVR